MDDIVFQEETAAVRRKPPTPRKKGIADWMVMRGYARDTSRANLYLMALTVAAVIGAILIKSTVTPHMRESRVLVPLIKTMPQGMH